MGNASTNPEQIKRPAARRHRLVYALFFSFLMVGSIPLILSAWKFVTFNKEWLGRNQRVIQLQSGKHIGARIDAYLESCSKDILVLTELLGSDGQAEEFRRQLSSPRVDSLLKKIIARSYFSQLHVLGPEGTGFGVSIGASSSEFDSVLRQAFENSLKESELIISPPVEWAGSGRYLVFSKRVQNGGQTLGVVLGLVSLEPLAERIREVGVDDEFLVVDGQGRVILGSRNEETEMVDRGLLQEITKSGQVGRNIIYATAEGARRKIATLVPTRNVGWFVIVQADEEVTYYPVRRVVHSTYFWLAFAFILAGLSGLVVSRRISEPVRRLVATSESLAAGNFHERVDIRSRNEIGELGDHFNTMAAKIQGYVEDLRTAAQQNRQLFLEAVHTIAAAIDEKDPYTKGHSERVTHYAVQVAEEMGLSPEEVENIRLSALLHDVGKIGIPDEILQKPVSLDSREFETMKQHPVKGARIMGQISQLQDVIPGILHHHEKVDGTGYPDGLRGSEIPLQARIISVVDTFDALTTQRPYQEAMDLESAVKRVESLVGTRYDAGVVEALKSAIERKRIKLRRSMPRPIVAEK